MLFQKEMRLPIDSEVIPPQNLYSSLHKKRVYASGKHDVNMR